MEIKLVESEVFDNEWKALPDVSTSSVNLEIVIEKVLYFLLMIQLIVSNIVPFQELTDWNRIIGSDILSQITLLLGGIIIK